MTTLKSINYHFAMDQKRAYLNRKPIEGAHGSSVEIIDSNFASDEEHIFYYGYTGEDEHNIVILPLYYDYTV